MLQPNRSFWAWDDADRVRYLIGVHRRLDGAGNVIATAPGLYRYDAASHTVSARAVLNPPGFPGALVT
jgi:hypothetical protein